MYRVLVSVLRALSCFRFDIEGLKLVEYSFTSISIEFLSILLEQAIDFLFLLALLTCRPSFLHLIFFGIQIVFSEDEVTFSERSLHLLLHFILQLLLIASKLLARSIALRLVH